MECNKGDAKIAMEMAEKKVTEKDYSGAKRLAKKAQKMYPDLDGLNKLMVIIEVYISGAKKIFQEPDWYGIIGVDSSASVVEVRKQYLKLVLMLHPDKNKFKGAEGAFKLLSEAWILLSDEDKRNAYNEKIKVKGTQQQQTTTSSSKPRGRKGRSNVVVSPPPSASSMEKERTNGTFWTKCYTCRTMHEYQRVYVDQYLRCQICKGCFNAVEIIPENDSFWTQCEKCLTHYEHQWVYAKRFMVCQLCKCSYVAEEKPPPSHIPEATNQQHQRSSGSEQPQEMDGVRG